MEDNRGEFVEVAFPQRATSEDTLSIFFENKLSWSGIPPKGISRMLFIRDMSLCPQNGSLFCDKLSSAALPNSRMSLWTLQYGACLDSAKLPVPKAGKSFQRIEKSFDDWVFDEPSPGFSNRAEPGVRDCRVKINSLAFVNENWETDLSLDGCDSLDVFIRIRSLYSSIQYSDFRTILLKGEPESFKTNFSAKAVFLRLVTPEDDYPQNDTLDTLAFLPGKFPVKLSEIHPCPDEGIPEWIEVFNSGELPISFENLNFCSRGKICALRMDSLNKQKSAVLSKDTLSLRSWLGIPDVRLLKADFGYLKNAADTLFLCYRDVPVDTVVWGKGSRIVPHCPAGFSTRTGRAEDSPGFQTPGNLAQDTALPFDVKWNARVFSKKEKAHPMMLCARSENSLDVELFSGEGFLLWKGFLPADPGGNYWAEIPLLSRGVPGPNFIRISFENHEKRIGVILRP